MKSEFGVLHPKNKFVSPSNLFYLFNSLRYYLSSINPIKGTIPVPGPIIITGI